MSEGPLLPPLLAAGVLGIEHFTPPWDVFFLPLFNGLVGLYKLLFSDFALAIIVFTVLVRTLLAPLFVRQIRSQKEMQAIQPLVKEVQRKYKGDRQKITQETMALYKEHNVNPAAGCLPVIIQLPILIALYNALTRASAAVAISGPCDTSDPSKLPLNCQLIDPVKLTQPVDTTIGWLSTPWAPDGLNLAGIDNVFAFSLFGGFVVSGLAVIAAVLQFVQVKMTTTNAQSDDPTVQATRTMTYLFPLMTILWGGIFPSGLVLYWIVYTAYLVVQQYLMMGWGNLFPLFGWTPGFGPRIAAETGLRAPARRPAHNESVQTKASKPSPGEAGANRRSGSQRRRRGRKAR